MLLVSIKTDYSISQWNEGDQEELGADGKFFILHYKKNTFVVESSFRSLFYKGYSYLMAWNYFPPAVLRTMTKFLRAKGA